MAFTAINFCIRCGIEETSFSHNSGVFLNYSTDKPSVKSLTEDIRRDFNLLSIIDHKCSIGLRSELLADHLSTFTFNSCNFL